MCQCFVLTGLKLKAQRFSPFQFLHRKLYQSRWPLVELAVWMRLVWARQPGHPAWTRSFHKRIVVIHSCRFSYSLFLRVSNTTGAEVPFLHQCKMITFIQRFQMFSIFDLCHKFTTTRWRKAAIRRNETISCTLEHFEGQEPAHDSNDASLAATLLSALLHRDFQVLDSDMNKVDRCANMRRLLNVNRLPDSVKVLIHHYFQSEVPEKWLSVICSSLSPLGACLQNLLDVHRSAE